MDVKQELKHLGPKWLITFSHTRDDYYILMSVVSVRDGREKLRLGMEGDCILQDYVFTFKDVEEIIKGSKISLILTADTEALARDEYPLLNFKELN